MTTQRREIRRLLRTRMAAAGERYTWQRAEIWLCLWESVQGLTVAELMESLKARGLGQATVYRGVKLLEKLGLVHLRRRSDGSHCYAPLSAEPGHPFTCLKCGRVVDVDLCFVDEIRRRLTQEGGYEVVSHNLEILGICPACRKVAP